MGMSEGKGRAASGEECSRRNVSDRTDLYAEQMNLNASHTVLKSIITRREQAPALHGVNCTMQDKIVIKGAKKHNLKKSIWRSRATSWSS